MFQKNWSKLSLILFLCFQRCFFTFDIQRSFVALQFIRPMTKQKKKKKTLNLMKEWEKDQKMFSDKYMFDDGWFYPIRKWVTEKTNFSSPLSFLVTPLPLPFTQKNLFGLDYPMTSPQPHMKGCCKIIPKQVRFAHFSKSLEKCLQSTTSTYTFTCYTRALNV
jgi:hypothetical protein